MKPFQTTVL